MPGLDEAPFDNELGQKIFETVSKEAWKLWVEQMKMIMNEYRLNLASPDAQEFLMEQMEQYFFGEGSAFRRATCRRKARTRTGEAPEAPAISKVNRLCAVRSAASTCSVSLPERR